MRIVRATAAIQMKILLGLELGKRMERAIPAGVDMVPMRNDGRKKNQRVRRLIEPISFLRRNLRRRRMSVPRRKPLRMPPPAPKRAPLMRSLVMVAFMD